MKEIPEIYIPAYENDIKNPQIKITYFSSIHYDVKPAIGQFSLPYKEYKEKP